MDRYGMCLYNLEKLRERQGGEFLELPRLDGIDDAVDLIFKAVELENLRLDKSEFESFIVNQAGKFTNGVSLKEVLEETANYYRKGN